ncbi:hypothetical protein [Brevibacillus marinus]|uniref:hypothetical protein n=1 Tax=Brevibacillus marinus TaxID=2496837 RepID=UPI000F825A43|nr:hypothetical protein [Brevibacillus marinus]
MREACPLCGRPKHPNQAYCPQCLDDETQVYRTVKEYLLTHPHSNAMQIANATGVPISRILKFVREGMLMMDGAKARESGSRYSQRSPLG